MTAASPGPVARPSNRQLLPAPNHRRNHRWLIAFGCLCSCVAYHPAPADAASIAEAMRSRPGGSFDLLSAVELAYRQNADLQALAARARAAGVTSTPVETQSEYRSEGRMLALMADPLALLDLGQRGAANTLLRAEALAAAEQLAVARWRTAAAIAEAFAVDATLAELPPAMPPPATEAYATAGLASAQALQTIASALHRQDAEVLRRERLRQANLDRLCELLGLAAGTPLQLQHQPLAVPLDDREEADLLQRPDLALATAQFVVADANFRQAVVAQYPNLMLGPEIPLGGEPLQVMAILRWPLAAGPAATAAGERREAARAELAAAFLAASREAAISRHEYRSALATERAASANFDANRRNSLLAQTIAEVEIDGFAAVADSIGMAVREWLELREARLLLARTTVQTLFACGMPQLEATR